jgi:hypothetical protein
MNKQRQRGCQWSRIAKGTQEKLQSCGNINIYHKWKTLVGDEHVTLPRIS